jgi:hypothetical protein
MDFIGGMLGFGKDPSEKWKEYQALGSSSKEIDDAKAEYDEAKTFLDSGYKQELSTLNQKKDEIQRKKDEKAEFIINKITTLSAEVKLASQNAKEKSDDAQKQANIDIITKINNWAVLLGPKIRQEKENVKKDYKLGMFGSVPEQYKPFAKTGDEIINEIEKIIEISRRALGKISKEESDKFVDQALNAAGLIIGIKPEELKPIVVSTKSDSLLTVSFVNGGLYNKFMGQKKYAIDGELPATQSFTGDLSRLPSVATGGDGSVTFSYTFLIIAVVLILIMLFLHFHLKRSRMPYTKVVEYC